MKNSFLFFSLFFSSSIFAEDKKMPLMEPVSIGSMMQVFVSLAAVLLLFGGIVYVLKRLGGIRTGQGGKMHVLDGVSVGSRDRVLLIQVGEKQVLIGVSPSGISPITVFDEPVISDQEISNNGFSGQLQKQIKSRLNKDVQTKKKES